MNRIGEQTRLKCHYGNRNPKHYLDEALPGTFGTMDYANGTEREVAAEQTNVSVQAAETIVLSQSVAVPDDIVVPVEEAAGENAERETSDSQPAATSTPLHQMDSSFGGIPASPVITESPIKPTPATVGGTVRPAPVKPDPVIIRMSKRRASKRTLDEDETRRLVEQIDQACRVGSKARVPKKAKVTKEPEEPLEEPKDYSTKQVLTNGRYRTLAEYNKAFCQVRRREGEYDSDLDHTLDSVNNEQSSSAIENTLTVVAEDVENEEEEVDNNVSTQSELAEEARQFDELERQSERYDAEERAMTQSTLPAVFPDVSMLSESKLTDLIEQPPSDVDVTTTIELNPGDL